MISVNTNITSLVVQNHFTLANNCIQTSLERLSTGFKINRAADDAANLSVSKNMECQISGSKVALDNAQQAINLVQTADAAMGEMQDIAQRIRELALQSANGTYSDQERAMIQQEVSSLVDEIYKQRNNAKFNNIYIFGAEETPPSHSEIRNQVQNDVNVQNNVNESPEVEHPILRSAAPKLMSRSALQADGSNSANSSVDSISTPPLSENSVETTSEGDNGTPTLSAPKLMGAPMLAAAPTTAEGVGATNETNSTQGYQPVTPLTEDEARAQGYEIVKTAEDFANIKKGLNKKYCLMCDIDFSKVSGWGYVTTKSGFELNGNGYAIKNFVINSETNSTMHGLFYDIVSGSTVKNLNMENVSIESTQDCIGALCGGADYDTYGTIDNCTMSGSVTGKSKTGGLVGYAQGGSITNCSVSGTVTGKFETGGLAGQSYASITNSSSSATVTGNDNHTGGLVGWAGGDSSITNSSASGNVTGTGENTGGLVGQAAGTITNSSASGSVTGNGDCTGGLVGNVYKLSNITSCSASGNVTGNNKTGGLVGNAWENSWSLTTMITITSCSASGNVTGTGYSTGGLAGCVAANITSCSASGNVTGTGYDTGGLVGSYENPGIIDKSYTTGDIKGTDYVGGLVGSAWWDGTISNSYTTGNIEGSDSVGGAVGYNDEFIISNSYSTGKVTGDTNVGGFIGEDSGEITNCYTTSDTNFYGNKTYGSINNCHGTTNQPGVTGHEPEWFNDVNNLKTVLGDGFDYSVIPPDINGNKRPIPPPPPPPPTTEGIQFQIGANSGEENTLKIDTSFSLNGFDADVTTREKANETIDKVDALISEFSIRRSGYGAVQNRLESVMDSLTTKTNNLSASHSTIVDTDFAAESANLVKAQILQNATAALLAQANSAPSIALRLLE